MNTSSPKRRGRPPGSNSFAKIKVQDLVSMVGEHAIVKVSTTWLRENNISIEPKATIMKFYKEPTEPAVNENKISFSVTNFDDEVEEDEISENEWSAPEEA